VHLAQIADKRPLLPVSYGAADGNIPLNASVECVLTTVPPAYYYCHYIAPAPLISHRVIWHSGTEIKIRTPVCFWDIEIDPARNSEYRELL